MEAQLGRKKPKTLSGIETGCLLVFRLSSEAGKNLKPYQGLKPVNRRALMPGVKAGKNLKPYQGLKQLNSPLSFDCTSRPEKT